MTCFGPGCSWPIMTVWLLPSFSHNSRRALDAWEEGAEFELWLSRARGIHFRADDFVCLCVKVLQSCPTLCNPMECSPSMGFSRLEYWSGLLCPPPGNLPDPGIEPTSLMSPALAGRFFTTSATWEALSYLFSLHDSCTFIVLYWCLSSLPVSASSLVLLSQSCFGSSGSFVFLYMF